MFADNIVLISLSKKGMQRQLDILEQYCKDKHLKVNMDKTKALSFCCPAAQSDKRKRFTFAEQEVDQETSYMYLGLHLNVTQTYQGAAIENANRAAYASWALVASLSEKQLSNSKAVIRVWDACILSRLSYAVEVWGPSSSKQRWEHTEQIQTDFMRNHLHIRQIVSTTNLLAELGRYLLDIVAMARTLRYIKKLLKR